VDVGGGTAAFGRRFVQVAQPYFLPAGGGDDGGRWLGLLAALLVGVVSGTMWVALGLGSVLRALAPAVLSPEATAALALLGSTPSLLVAGAGLSAAAAVAWSSRKDVEGRGEQWLLLALLLFLLFSVTGLNVLLSYVFRAIDNVLVSKDAAAFYAQLGTFAVVLLVAVPIIGCYRLVRLTLARNWRDFLTRFFLEEYMMHRAYYRLDSNSAAAGGIDNPDQRLTEDIDAFTRETLDFLLDVLDSVLNLASFSSILWATSRELTLSLVLYACAGTAAALAAGEQLLRLNATQLRREADLRYSLVHVRDSAEAIAFYAGERRELETIGARFAEVLANLTELISWGTGLSIFQQAFFYLARLVPYLVIGGLYLAGDVDFGTLGQGTFAFSMVLSSVTLVVARIQDISRFSAGVERLAALRDALRQPAAPGPPRIATALAAGPGLRITGLRLETPDGRRTLLRNLELRLGAEGEPQRVLVVGPSGAGKSSLLRAAAGLWDRGAGVIVRPPAGETVFLPQKPYMPLGSLRAQLLYPGDGPAHGDRELYEVLGLLGLGGLPERFEGGLDAVEDWARTLSLGEQQRVAAARCLLRRPKLAVLDEATSALPADDEQRLYQRFRELGFRYLSVGHRSSLLDHHDHVLELRGPGEWQLLAVGAYKAGAARAAGAAAPGAAGP